MIVRCTSEFPNADDDKRTDSHFFKKEDLVKWVEALPESALITSDSIIEATWSEIR